MHSSNEGKAIHAAVKLLEAIEGQAATEGENPDRGGTRRGIDWRMRIGETAYSMERTEVPGERTAGETVDKVGAISMRPRRTSAARDATRWSSPGTPSWRTARKATCS